MSRIAPWFVTLSLAAAPALPTLLAPSEASACSCLPGSFLRFPSADAVDVPTDTTLVFAGSGAPSLAPVAASDASPSDAGVVVPAQGWALRSAAGQWLELELIDEVTNEVLCTGDYHLVRPNAPLEANTLYEVWSEGELSTSFTTGAEAMPDDLSARAEASLQWFTLGNTNAPSDVATVYQVGTLDFPYFIHWKGANAEQAFMVTPGNEGDAEPFVLQVNTGVMECPEIELLGLDGQPFLTRQFCAAERCAVLESFAISSCGGNADPTIDYAQFGSLPECGGSAEAVTDSDMTGGGPPAPSSDSGSLPEDGAGPAPSTADDSASPRAAGDRTETDADGVPFDSPDTQVSSRGIDEDRSDGCAVTRSSGELGNPFSAFWLFSALASAAFTRRRFSKSR